MNELPVRTYQMPDSDLSMYVFILHATLLRDILYLEEFGITEAKLDELFALQQQFQTLPTHGQMRARKKQVLEVRENKRVALLETVGAIRQRVESAFGRNHSAYEEFNFDRIARAKDTELPTRLSMIADAGVNYLAELSEYGQTLAELTALQTEAAAFTAILNDVNKASANRKETTRERITLGNQMYYIASTYAKIAQQKFSNTNPAKYLDYVIYRNRKKKKPKTDE